MSPSNGSGNNSDELCDHEKWVGEWKGWREGVRWEMEGMEGGSKVGRRKRIRRSGGSECACVWGGGGGEDEGEENARKIGPYKNTRCH